MASGLRARGRFKFHIFGLLLFGKVITIANITINKADICLGPFNGQHKEGIIGCVQVNFVAIVG
jgi:hypothetical protein